jgi:hypothetical protein
MGTHIKREYGAEQPFIPAGIFKIRIPGIHSGWEITESIQGALMVATPLSASTLVTNLFGIPFEIAIMWVLFNNIMYVMHPLLGDPVFPGWITPGMALVSAFLATYPEGVERIHALIALQLVVGIIFLVLGVTGAAAKLVTIVPPSMRGGILLGAGISSMTTCITNQMKGHELSLCVGMAVTILFMYSLNMGKAKKNNKVLMGLGRFGLIVGLLVAYVIAVARHEIPAPSNLLKDGWITSFANFDIVLKEMSVFGVGLPPASTWVAVIPMAFTEYIIAFGDFVYSQVLMGESVAERGDEFIDYNPNRSNIICAIRNFIMGVFIPYPPILGPLWGAGVTSVAERYKHGRQEMDSIFDGLFPYILIMTLGLIIRPIVNIFQPVLFLGMGLSYAVQGFASLYIAMEMLPSKEERACGGLMAVFLAQKGATWGLASGIILHFLVGVSEERKAEEKAAAARDAAILEEGLKKSAEAQRKYKEEKAAKKAAKRAGK